MVSAARRIGTLADDIMVNTSTYIVCHIVLNELLESCKSKAGCCRLGFALYVRPRREAHGVTGSQKAQDAI